MLIRSWLLLAAGYRRGAGNADLAALKVPDTRLARAVLEVARSHQHPLIMGHAMRTVAYAHAIAALDGLRVDAELLWCAGLLHDVCLEPAEAGHCFAVRGGQLAVATALQAGATPETANLLGDAVCRHATPGLDPNQHPVPYLVATGALVDIAGSRLEQMEPDFVRRLVAAHPREGFAAAIASAWRTETRCVRDGRAAVANRLGFSAAARIAPLAYSAAGRRLT